MNSMYEGIAMKDLKGVWHCLLAVKLETMAGESLQEFYFGDGTLFMKHVLEHVLSVLLHHEAMER